MKLLVIPMLMAALAARVSWSAELCPSAGTYDPSSPTTTTGSSTITNCGITDGEVNINGTLSITGSTIGGTVTFVMLSGATAFTLVNSVVDTPVVDPNVVTPITISTGEATKPVTIRIANTRFELTNSNWGFSSGVFIDGALPVGSSFTLTGCVFNSLIRGGYSHYAFRWTASSFNTQSTIAITHNTFAYTTAVGSTWVCPDRISAAKLDMNINDTKIAIDDNTYTLSPPAGFNTSAGAAPMFDDCGRPALAQVSFGQGDAASSISFQRNTMRLPSYAVGLLESSKMISISVLEAMSVAAVTASQTTTLVVADNTATNVEYLFDGSVQSELSVSITDNVVTNTDLNALIAFNPSGTFAFSSFEVSYNTLTTDTEFAAIMIQRVRGTNVSVNVNKNTITVGEVRPVDGAYLTLFNMAAFTGLVSISENTVLCPNNSTYPTTFTPPMFYFDVSDTNTDNFTLCGNKFLNVEVDTVAKAEALIANDVLTFGINDMSECVPVTRVTTAPTHVVDAPGSTAPARVVPVLPSLVAVFALAALSLCAV